MKRSFGGRPRHKCWEDKKFLPIQDEGKTVAYCCLCENILKNTSQVRLQMHRKNCHEKSDSVVVVSGEMLLNSESELNAEDAEVVEVVEVAEPLIDNSDNNANLLKLKQKQKKNKTSNTQIRPFFDKISDKDEVRINEALMKFFCGCNVPFEAVESDHFLNLMKTMRPAYKPPTKEMLTNSFLHNLHKQLITDESTLVNSDGILMIKQTSFQNSKQIVTFAKTVQGKIFYLKSWNISLNIEDVINEALHIAKTKYFITIYSIITDQDYQTLTVTILNEQSNMWIFNCNLSFASSLERILLDEGFADKVHHLLVQFSDLQEDLLKRDGAIIILSNTTACSDLHDMYASCKKNLAAMRQIIGEGICKLKRAVVDILFDETFEQELQDSLDMYESICSIRVKCKSSCTLFADTVEDWLILEALNNNLTHRIQETINKIITPVALAANFCHPNYQGERFRNDKIRMIKMTEFFIDALNAKGLADYEAYRSSSGIFEKLKSKECHDPRVFWDTVKPFHGDLAAIAVKLVEVPASVISLEPRVVHQNGLTPDRLQKLTDLYYDLKIRDKHVTNEY